MAQFLLRAFFVAIAGFLLIWFGLPVLHSDSPEATKILSAIVGLPGASASTNEAVMAEEEGGATNHVSQNTAPLPEAHPVPEPVAEEAPASPQPPASAPAKPAESVVGSAAEKFASMAANAVSAAKKAISEAKLYLRETDYIVLKIAAATAEGDAEAVASLCAEYAEQLSKRKQARVTVNANEARVRAVC